MKLGAAALVVLTLASACSNVESPAAHSNKALAAGVRRLSTAELDAAAADVLGQPLALSSVLPPDTRQFDFSRNVAQTVDPLTLRALYDATNAASQTIDLRRAPFPDCAASARPRDAVCVTSTIRAVARQAFRRAPTDDEIAKLKGLFDIGATDADFSAGAALVVRALLGSPKFLYETALGDGATGSRISLSDAELASALAWLVSGQPPDDELLAAADAGELRVGGNREQQAVRLLQKSESRFLLRRFVAEWFGTVRLDGLAKSSEVVANFASLRQAMFDETNEFVDAVMSQQGGSLTALLAGGFSVVPSALARLYGIEPTSPGARVALTQVGRIGILQQGAFLATFAHESESAPVLRGKAVLERLLCANLPKPTDLKLNITFPAPDPHATTRARYAQHATDPVCKGCHVSLDGVGFTFENFDAIGKRRTTENGQPIDTSGQLLLAGTTTPLRDSLDLSRALADSEEVRTCAARQVVRFAAGQSALDVELGFANSVAKLPLERRASVLGLLLEYVKSGWFATREAR
ncbi:MAG: DUF1592 domain-containing protein [Polyangiaceae bacterium]